MDLNSLKVLFTSLPGRYANALFKEGKKENCLNEILENFIKLEEFFKGNIALKKLLTGHSMNKKELDSCWLSVGEYLSFCPVFLSFIRQVVVNGRFEIINKIKYIFNVALAKYKNRRNVAVSSSVELLPEQKIKIEGLIAKTFKEKANVIYKVNEKILGGIKIASEELVIDASAIAQLKQLSNYFKNLKLKADRI